MTGFGTSTEVTLFLHKHIPASDKMCGRDLKRKQERVSTLELSSDDYWNY